MISGIRPARDPQLRAHPGPRDREPRAVHLAHGHAVSVGLVYAAILGSLTGRPDFVEQTRDILTGLACR